MQTVVFVDSQMQRLGAASMDVPRVGEQVVLETQALFTVAGVRYYVYPNNPVRVAVLLTAATPDAVVYKHYETLKEASLQP